MSSQHLPPALLDSTLEAEETRPEPFWRRHRVLLLLLLILACSTYFRFYGRAFDDFTGQNPDERSIIAFNTTAISWPSSWENFLDRHTSLLNLRRDQIGGCNDPINGCTYPWGAFPIYAERAVAWVFDTVLPPSRQQPDGYWLMNLEATAIIGRSLASIFDLITIVLIFLIGRRLYSSSTGLIAAALYGFAVTAIQIAHFFIVESFLVAFMTGAIYFSVVLMQRPRWWAAAGAGACLGLAVSSKVSVLPVALVVVAAVALRALYRTRTRKLGAEFGDPIGVSPSSPEERGLSLGGHLLRGLRYVVLAAVFSILAFGIGEPYVLWSFDFSTLSGGLEAFLNSNPWSRRIQEEARVQGGIAYVPFTLQYIGTVPVVYQLEQMVYWGIGLVPGLMTVFGFVAALWHALRRRPAELLLMSAAIPYFLTITPILTKWMRYMLPLVPIFCLFGAAFLVRGTIWARRRFVAAEGVNARSSAGRLVRVQRAVFPALVVMSIGWAFLWAVAFMNIYTQPHSRIQASEWIHNNVPRESTISHEDWDDALPLSLPPLAGKDRSGYPISVNMTLYDSKPPEAEVEQIKTWLRELDYIIITSNKQYRSMPRLLWAYPAQTEYYRLLFAEKLGFIRVHTTQVSPELLGIKINDQPADESFTVYDHPRVDVFKKVSELTDDQYRMLFSSALDRTSLYNPSRQGSVPDDKGLSYSQPVNTLPQLDDYAWNPLGQEDTQWFAVALWLALVEALGLLALPIVFTVFRNLPDRGYAVAKLAALLMVAWGVWIAASARALPFTVWSVLLMVAVMAALSALCWRLGAGRDIRAFFATRRNLVLAYEAVFLLAFAAVLALRIANPDLWHPIQGGEKPMEIGFLNSVLRSAWMPPLDPFFAGGFINYYYYGYFVVACLIKVLGIHPAIAFNLAAPLFYALTFTAGMSVVYNLVAWSQKRRGSASAVSRSGLVFGVGASCLMLVIGNLHGLWQWIMISFPQVGLGLLNLTRGLNFGEQSMFTQYPAFNWWDASRIISHTINEFPYWTFLFADLHPHLMDMPFTVLAIIFTQNLLFAGGYRRPLPLAYRSHELSWRRALWLRVSSTLSWLWGPGAAGVLNFALMALTLGALLVINSWDFPTYLGLAGGGVIAALLMLGRHGRVDSDDAQPAEGGPQPGRIPPLERASIYGIALASMGGLAALALLYYLPFFLNFKAFYTSILPLIDGGQIPKSLDFMHRTTLAEFLVVWGLFVFVAASYLVYRLWHFPWGAAADSLMGIVPGPTAPARGGLSPQQAFTRFGHSASRNPRKLVPALSVPGGGTVSLSGPFRFMRGPGEGSLDEAEAEARNPNGPSPDLTVTDETSDGKAHLGDGNGSSRGVDGGARADASPIGGWLSTANVDEDRTLKVRRRVSLGGPQPAGDVGNGAAGLYDEPGVEVEEVPLAQEAAVSARSAPQPGVIPLWAGLGLLGITAALVVLQMVTGQWLLALLVALIGGIAATTLSTSRTAANLFCGLLMLVALAVAMGVELVYLADHLEGGIQYRMNTVFKFYIQVWVLFALASAASIYYMLYSLRERATTAVGARSATQSSAPDTSPATSPDHEVSAAEIYPRETQPQPNGSDAAEPYNWVVWSLEHAGDGASIAREQSPVVAAPRYSEIESHEPPAETTDEGPSPSINWTVGRLVWLGALALLLMSTLIFTLLGTPDRLSKRFPITPPAGTLNGLKFMTTGTYVGGDPPMQVNLRYDYEAINWLNSNVKGVKVLAELPAEYYRAYGMRAAANTGLSMVVGGLHQDEQRSGSYARLVGDRRGDMETFFTTPDVQVALTILSKYDIDYIYLGQLEQARAGATGMPKFAQLAGPGVEILREVFRTQQPANVPGTIIYEVVRRPDREVSTLVGAPVENSGIPGISITPLPTPTATPVPTPPTDDPELQQLINLVAQDPFNRDNRFKLVDWYRTHNFPLDAARELQVLVDQDPQNIALRHMLGDAYQQGGQPELALKAWEDARDVDPNNPAGHNKVGIAYLERKRYDDAVREFQATVDREPRFVEAYYHMGEAYQLLGERDKALAAYQSVIDKAPPGAEGWVDAANQRLAEIP